MLKYEVRNEAKMFNMDITLTNHRLLNYMMLRRISMEWEDRSNIRGICLAEWKNAKQLKWNTNFPWKFHHEAKSRMPVFWNATYKYKYSAVWTVAFSQRNKMTPQQFIQKKINKSSARRWSKIVPNYSKICSHLVSRLTYKTCIAEYDIR